MHVRAVKNFWTPASLKKRLTTKPGETFWIIPTEKRGTEQNFHFSKTTFTFLGYTGEGEELLDFMDNGLNIHYQIHITELFCGYNMNETVPVYRLKRIKEVTDNAGISKDTDGYCELTERRDCSTASGSC